ncbi:MAG TPA: extracellular solute-binding protein [Abditibacteriaceae bacterium]|nr:extracellular solute-binding protein [Abditibacteriaceae bacterium]
MLRIRNYLPLAVIFCVICWCAGCRRSGTAPSGSPGTDASGGGEQLTIVSPNGREIQVEFERAFKLKHPNVSIKWLSQGGGTDDLREVQSRFAGKKEGEGIDRDIFFGGGPDAFAELEKDGFLQPLPSDFGVPATLNGVPLRGKNNTWVAAAVSGFGILYNKTIAARDKLPVPVVWGDLGNPALNGRIELADPRHSSSAHTAYEIILQSHGWEKGWQVLTAMAGNSRAFSASSSDLLQDVDNGEAVMVPAIDFYARAKIAQAGDAKLGYIAPRGQLVVTPDPIGILRGAPHLKLAQEFVKFVMSPEGQKLWMLKKGAAGGPVENELYRQAALPSLYKPIPKDSLIRTDPFDARNTHPFDAQKAALRRQALDDLIGAVLIDNQDALRELWAKNPRPERITFVPVGEAEFMKLAAGWTKNPVQRQKTIIAWNQAVREHLSNQ